MNNEAILKPFYEALSYQKPSWNEIIERFKNKPKFNQNRVFTQKYLQDQFSEIHLDIIVEKALKKIPFYHLMDVNLEPFGGQSKIDEIIFHEDSNSHMVASDFEYYEGRFFPKDITEYDKLIKINDSLIVFEIKIKAWSSGLNKGLGEKEYIKKTRAFQESIGCNPELIMILPKDTCNDSRFKGYMNKFNMKYGKIIPLYASIDEFRKDVFSISRKNKLNLYNNN